MTAGGQLDALMSAATSPLAFGRPLPAFNSPRAAVADGLFQQTLAEELARADSPYRPKGASADDIEVLLAGVDQDKLQEIDDVGSQFESLIVFTLFKQMWATLPESTFFGNGMDSQIYREMWLEEMANEITCTGQGLGIAPSIKWEMIYREMNTISPDEPSLNTRL